MESEASLRADENWSDFLADKVKTAAPILQGLMDMHGVEFIDALTLLDITDKSLYDFIHDFAPCYISEWPTIIFKDFVGNEAHYFTVWERLERMRNKTVNNET